MHHTSESHREIHAHVKHTNNARKWLPAKTNDRKKKLFTYGDYTVSLEYLLENKSNIYI
jgi:hypothetical protein